MVLPKVLALKLLAFVGLVAALPIKNDASLEPRSKLVPGGLKLDFTVTRRVPLTNSTRARKRSIYDAEINHNAFYTVQLSFGSQQSPVGVDLDTGSSDLWIPSPGTTCNGCTQFGSFDPLGSSTAQDQYQQFYIGYVDQSSSQGEFYLDQVLISGETANNVIFAVVTQASTQCGILGVGFASNEAMVPQDGYQYANFPEVLVSDGLISKNFYSLWLNSPNATQGSILFGGIDSTKYSGPLVTLPNTSTQNQQVNLESITAGASTLTANYQVVLDSGTTFTYLNQSQVEVIASAYPGSYLNPVGFYAVDCNNIPTGDLTYSFAGIDIKIPLTSLVGPQFDAQQHVVPGCVLDIGTSSDSIPPILGDNFLRYAYVVYDLTDLEILVAQAVISD